VLDTNDSKYRFGRFMVANRNIVATAATLFVKMEPSKPAFLFFQMNAIL